MRAATAEKYQLVLNVTKNLVDAVPLLGTSPTSTDYQEALLLVEFLIDHDDENPLIDLLAKKIADYENNAPEYKDFNARIATLPRDLAMLRTLMDQHGLNQSSFVAEIGSRSLVSMIMRGQRALTLEHMRALSARFNIPVSAFIEDNL
ncbi:helix-turn-helix domain-containing protein [Erwinia mallotivora]|uniref:XRE family transcriptional regulator n=1 Tax=Erwinia mallotivora TaxID=69222 RepID=A0A014MF12_9GAMM|nr:helix-turn-helix domain-containing protein [Erwinia mallotivora]EXU76654.1 XRE family transcriptional regulator [Erwinia mallotivora]